jgi:hypothetical protein
VVPTYPDDFSFTTTPSSGAFLGQVTIDDVAAEDNGVDIIAAFEPVAEFVWELVFLFQVVIFMV